MFVGAGGRFGCDESSMIEYSEVFSDSRPSLDNVRDDSDTGDEWLVELSLRTMAVAGVTVSAR